MKASILSFLFLFGITIPIFSQCTADGNILAPGSFTSSTTLSGNTCPLRPTANEEVVEVQIPCDGMWRISTCSPFTDFDTYLFIGTSCCSDDIISNDDDTYCGPGSKKSNIDMFLPAGTYFVTVEGFSVMQMGNYVLEVLDITPPVINCPSDTSISLSGSQCYEMINYDVPVGTDNCSGAISGIFSGHGSGAAFPLGTNTETYLVTDASGNTATCSFLVEIEDVSDPQIIGCPSDIILPTDSGACTSIATWAAPLFVDNCLIDSLIQTSSSGDLFQVGTKEVDYTVIDASGNFSNCTFNVTIEDREDPIIFDCPADIALFSDSGSCGAIVSWVEPTTTDNCGILSFTPTFSVGGFFTKGVSSVSYLAQDYFGNSASCVFEITVSDNEVPSIECPSDTIIYTANGACFQSFSYLNPVVIDNCPGTSLTSISGLGSGAFFPLGVSEEIYQVTDAAGNMDSCSFKISVLDNEDPVVSSCPTNVTATQTPGGCTGIGTWVEPMATDNCSPVSLSSSHLSGSIFSLGVTNVVYTFTDDSGNTSNCSFDVVVNDQEAPFFSSCPDSITVFSDAFSCDMVVNWPTPIAEDYCSALTMASNFGPGSIFPLGSTSVNYTATDSVGNASTCNFLVIVMDTNSPQILCPANIATVNTPGQCGAIENYTIPLFTDNCIGSSIQLISGSGTGGFFPMGLTTEVYSASDGSGNTSTCSFTITVSDTELPTYSGCPLSPTGNTLPGTCNGIVTWTDPIGDDNCGSVSTTSSHSSGDTFNVGLTTVSFLGMDGSGNSVQCVFDVMVTDQENPEVTSPAQQDLVISTDSGSPTAVVTYNVPAGIDNCGSVSSVMTLGIASGQEFPIGTTVVTYLLTDLGGNTSSHSFTVTVEDNENPIISCPSDTVISSPGIGCPGMVSYIEPTSTDNSGIGSPIQLQGLTNGGLFPIGATTQFYVVSDPSGNQDSCSFQIIVQDTTSLSFSGCLSDTLIYAFPNECSAIMNWQSPAVPYNCLGMFVSSTHNMGDTLPQGFTTITHYLQDAQNIVDSCSYTVEVKVGFFPYSEDFDSPDCWGVQNLAGTTDWIYSPSMQYPNLVANSGQVAIFSGSGSQIGDQSLLYSPVMDFNMVSGSPTLIFDLSQSNDMAAVEEEVSIVVSTDGGLTWSTPIKTYTGYDCGLGSPEFLPMNLDLSDYATEESVVIGFVGTSGGGSNLGIESVEILGTDCPIPQSLSLDSVSFLEAEVSWDAVSGAGYQVQYRPVFPACGPWITVSSMDEMQILSGLSVGTTYQWRARSLCNGTTFDGTSIEAGWSCIEEFTTPCSQPINFVVDSVDHSTVMLNWETELAVDQFQVSYQIAGTTGNWTILSTTTSSITISGLDPNTDYEYRVRDYCGSIQSFFGWSPINNFTTLPSPCQPPYNLSVQSIGTNSAIVHWDSDTYSTEYQVSYRILNSNESWHTRLADTTFRLITDLNEGETYEWRVRDRCSPTGNTVYNWIGPDTFETVQNCVKPENLNVTQITHESAQLTWTTSVPLALVEIAFREIGSPTWGTRLVSGNNYILSGLIPETEYEWKIRDKCDNGFSAFGFTNIDTFMTGPIPCSQPFDLLTVYTSLNTAQLSWSNSPGLVTEYQVAYREMGIGEQWSTRLTMDKTILLTDLKFGTNYEWKVRERCNPVGNTQFNFTIEERFTTEGYECSEIRELQTLDISSTSAEFNWVVDIAQDSFQVAFKNATAGEDWSTRMAYSTSFLAEGLLPGRTYHWKVRDQCKDGHPLYGFTNHIVFTTPGLTPGGSGGQSGLSLLDINIYPNPTSGEAFIEFYFESDEKLEIELLDLRGKVIQKFDYEHSAGLRTYEFESTDLPKGIYLVKAKAGIQSRVIKLKKQ